MSMIPENTRLTRALEFAFEPDETAHTLIGPYKLLEKIGEGGFGVVWMAEQQEPVRRRVALKIVKAGMDTRELIARFEAERQALAMMDHPNIARVFDAGATETGRPYFVMELVRGTPITQFCDENRIPTEARLRLFIDVCQAVQHAHQKGIIHRDLKPSNILITLHDDKPVPKVIDFGIAKALGGAPLTDKTLFTRFHTFIGTPAYTSPEQIGMSGLDIDTRSDIYALGVLLYVLLTGETPFDAQALASSSFEEIRETIRTVEPPRPSQRVRARTVGGALSPDSTPAPNNRGIKPLPQFPATAEQLRGDLDWVVMRCLEKDRARRYESAAALAADVQRHLAHEPVVARPPSAAYTLQKLVRRHRVAFVSAAAIAAALVIGAVVSTWQAYRASSAEREQTRLREAAERAQAAESELRGQAQQQELIARRRAYAADMNLLQQALAADNFGRAQELLRRQRPAPGQPDLRGWEWRYLWPFCQSDAQAVICENRNRVGSVAISADGEWLAVGDVDLGGLSVFSLRTKREIRVPAGNDYVWVAFSPREPVLAVAIAGDTMPNRVLLWDATTQRSVREIVIPGRCGRLAFCDEGRQIVVQFQESDRAMRVGLWRVADGAPGARFLLPSDARLSGEYAPFASASDLSSAAFVTGGRTVVVVDLLTGQERWRSATMATGGSSLAYSADGRLLAAGGDHLDSTIRVWESATGRETALLKGHGGGVRALAFLPDGRTLASASLDQTVRLWNLETRQLARTLRGHKLEVWALAAHPDNRTVASGSKDGAVYLWGAAATAPSPASFALPGRIVTWRFTAKGSAVIAINSAGEVTRRSGGIFQNSEALFRTEPCHAAILDVERSRVATASADGRVSVWDWNRRSKTLELAAEGGEAHPVGFVAHGETLLIARGSGPAWSSIEARDLRTGERKQAWPIASVPMGAALVSEDGRHVVFAATKGHAILDLASGQTVLSSPLRARGAAFSPDGGIIAIPLERGTVRLWDAASRQEIATLQGFPLAARQAAFSPDGRRLAVTSVGAEALRVWDTASWEPVLTLPGPVAQNLGATAFSADGNVFGTLMEQRVHLWRAPSWAEIEAAEKERRGR